MVKLGTREEWANRPIGLIGKENCPLCDTKNNLEYTLWEGEKWFISINPYPYTGDEYHILAFPKEHKELSTTLSAEELAELHHVYAFIEGYFTDKEYFSFTRETFGSRSIKHLHMHFIGGVIDQSAIIEGINTK